MSKERHGPSEPREGGEKRTTYGCHKLRVFKLTGGEGAIPLKNSVAGNGLISCGENMQSVGAEDTGVFIWSSSLGLELSKSHF